MTSAWCCDTQGLAHRNTTFKFDAKDAQDKRTRCCIHTCLVPGRSHMHRDEMRCVQAVASSSTPAHASHHHNLCHLAHQVVSLQGRQLAATCTPAGSEVRVGTSCLETVRRCAEAAAALASWHTTHQYTCCRCHCVTQQANFLAAMHTTSSSMRPIF